MKRLRVLAFAAARGRIGSVVLADGVLIDWRISDRAADGAAMASAYATRLIDDFLPDVVVSEEVMLATHKGQRTRTLIEALAGAAESKGLLTTTFPHKHDYPNKYAEAEALVQRFPELAPWQPKRLHFYDNEPRNTVLFEALSLALQLGTD